MKTKEAISKKKIIYPIQSNLMGYLKTYSRDLKLKLHYENLLDYDQAFNSYDKKGKDTLWQTVIYKEQIATEIYEELKRIYSYLKSGGNQSSVEHLTIEKIEYCSFGNTNPFRIKIVNIYNDVYDYFYIKRPDASRIYGLELEHLLAPDKINFLVSEHTLIEEHIPGISGDVFMNDYLKKTHYDFNKTRIAKEFVKFNERCLVRLLGDMRAYNYVFDITPDFDDTQVRIRAIDFDQQSYEGRKNIYLPQFFKENFALVELVMQLLPEKTIAQYQQEERSIIGRRSLGAKQRLKDLFHTMEKAELSTYEKVVSLRTELAEFYQDPVFEKCETMGMLLERSLKRILIYSLKKNWDW